MAACPARCAGALDEVEWLRTKLEALEAALLSGSLDSGLLAALDSGGIVPGAASAAEVLEAARAAVAGAEGAGGGVAAGLGLGLRQPLVVGADVAAGEPSGDGPAGLGSGGPQISMDPLASMLAVAAESATSTANQAVAEARAAAAALAAADGANSLAAATSKPAVPAELAGDRAEQGQAEEEDGEGRRAARAPLIDPYLVANPSELEVEGPAAAAVPGSAGSAGVGAAEEAEGVPWGEAALPTGELLVAQPPLAGAPQATLEVGRPPSVKAAELAAKLADSPGSGELPAAF